MSQFHKNYVKRLRKKDADGTKDITGFFKKPIEAKKQCIDPGLQKEEPCSSSDTSSSTKFAIDPPSCEPQRAEQSDETLKAPASQEYKCQGTSKGSETWTCPQPQSASVTFANLCSPYDFGDVFSLTGQLNQDERYRILQNIYKPESDHMFPKHREGACNRCFKYEWLLKYNWLVYSKSMDGGFCVPCVMFARGHRQKGALVKGPMKRFKNAIADFDVHAKCQYHQKAVLDMISFSSIAEQKHDDVSVQLNNVRSQRIAENRQKLCGILETVILCGKQNIALRGHREARHKNSATDESDDDSEDDDIRGNPGNFQVLLDLRVSAGDSVLEKHFRTCPRNATYRSKTIQNQLIELCGDAIRKSIIREIKQAKFFSVLADECADVSNKEQLSLVLRFVDQNNNIREEFLDFVLCEEGATGEAVANTIIKRLESFGLDKTYMRGQGYDGAGNMAGKVRGTAALISRDIPLAIYVHCNAYVLNLCIVKSCELQPIRNVMGVMKEMSIFFKYSPKRQGKLEEKIKEIYPDEPKTKLKDMCKTRWVERHETFEPFSHLYVAVVEVFQSIVDHPSKWNQETLTSAKALLLSVTNFDFLMSFVVCKQVLAFVKGLSTSLQAKNHNICKAMNEVTVIVGALQTARENAEAKNREWYQKAKSMSDSVGADEPQIPRKCGRQTHKPNTPARTVEDHYRVTVTVPFLDHMLSQLNERFSASHQKAAHGILLIPAHLHEDHDYTGLLNLYKADLPTPDNFESELACWNQKWSSWRGNVPTSLEDALDHADKMLYPNIHTLLRIVATLPVTTSECEKSFSCLKRLKTYLRSTMGKARLSGFALLNIHYPSTIDKDQIINEFARKYPRRMELIDILNTDE